MVEDDSDAAAIAKHVANDERLRLQNEGSMEQ